MCLYVWVYAPVYVLGVHVPVYVYAQRPEEGISGPCDCAANTLNSGTISSASKRIFDPLPEDWYGRQKDELGGSKCDKGNGKGLGHILLHL